VSPPQPGVSEVVTSMLQAVDNLDWTAVQAAFAPHVAVDYTSLWGGEAETLSVDELIGRWQRLLPGFDATQHLTGPILVTAAEGRSASCRTTVRGYHHVIDDTGCAATWMCAGQYMIGLARGPATNRWAISTITLQVSYGDGDRALTGVASKRAAAGIGGRTNPGRGPANAA
jgi:SnoaL-like domain